MVLKEIIEKIADLYYVHAKGLHKHNYQRIEDGTVEGINRIISYQRHQCTAPTCKKVVGLDDWQIESLPFSMLYESQMENN